MQRFSGKTVIVTGSSGGIGEGIARAFAAEGANVVLNSRNQADCEKVAADFDAERTLVVAGDVSSSKFVGELIASTVERFGGLDTLICNAGVAYSGPLEKTPDEQIDRVIDINVKGVIYLCREAIGELAKTKGSITIISSVSGLGGDWDLPVYNASKGAVSNLTRSLALQLGRKGIRVNAINPSITRSDMTDAITSNEALVKAALKRLPLGRVAEPEDIAGPTLFLSSDEARFVTGVNLPVDGGVSASNGQPNFAAEMGG
ncbi:meso-2,3-butanediol dehydrogenase [Qipengyuania sp. CAU 1752]